MDRRDFFKISAVTGATAALDGCGNPERPLIRFVPEEDLVPGVATWKPSICTLCPAGCGLMVRVMEGEAEMVRNGERGLIQMGLAKKLEGNLNHPVNRGKLCPRGQAGIQLTYHPDRIANPLKRSGPRGSGQFQEVSWDEAIKELVSRLEALRSSNQTSSLVFLTKLIEGQRRELINRFVGAFGGAGPVLFEPFEDTVLRRANSYSFGRPQLPTFDLASTNYLISFGADFIGAWNSPVAHSIAYGQMRQGRPGVRAKFVMIESRMSQTGANADEWIPARPGTEGVLALGLAHVIISEKLLPANSVRADSVLAAGWSQGLPDFTPINVEKRTGVPASTVTRIAREMAKHGPAVAMIGGAPLAHTNGLANALAVNALNELLGSVGKPGGILFTPELPFAGAGPPPSKDSKHLAYTVGSLAETIGAGSAGAAQVLLLYEANPVFVAPPAWRVREAIEKVPFIASFGCFIDESSILADLILPDHSPLESWLAHVPESGTTLAAASVAPPVMRPLHNTRAMPDLLLEVARQLGGDVAAALPWKTYDAMLQATFEKLKGQPGSVTESDADKFWAKVQDQGGWWSSEVKLSVTGRNSRISSALKLVEAEFDGPEQDFPFHFVPFPSQAFLDGSLAHLPWLQETPDPLSTAMWGTWVEINSKTAERLHIRQGDVIKVASQHGSLQAPALLSPGIAPGVIAMPVGQGHENYTRYASRRGANPLSILAPMVEPETKAFAWAATRVKISRVGEGKLVLFAGGMRERPSELLRR